ncbi:Two-component system sensor histidine kinase [Tenacibaculum maritimum]|nr:Two-component system sensor histidine kinase [Tenacibaculum maritimum]
MRSSKTLSDRLIKKLILAFSLIIVLMGGIYVATTLYFSQKFYNETSQKLNANVANHLVEEKFKYHSPFLKNGKVNKLLFDDLMHDMMAVNRAIEVYLLSEKGEILYSVVLDHSNSSEPLKKVSLQPIKKFINEGGYILGDDPKNKGEKKIFSVAPFEKDGRKGYVYIVLEGETFEKINESLFSCYFLMIITEIAILTMIFSFFIGWLCICFLTKNLRKIIFCVNRFSEGDLSCRIKNAETSDLSILAVTYNNMANIISKNIEEMKTVDSLRRELIANICHDLRSPLTTMQGYIETLQMKENTITSLDRKQYIQIIEKSTDYLKKLVSQLFEYSKLEAKQIEPETIPFSIEDLVYGIKKRYDLLAKEKEIKIFVEAAGLIPLVKGDSMLIERAILNLMDNAIKFTPSKGKIRIILFNDNDKVKVRIKDSGSGINKENRKLIFRRFAQTETKYKKEGVGLGLAIVEKIMELHKTKIEVRSYLNQGSAFEFSLPNYR